MKKNEEERGGLWGSLVGASIGYECHDQRGRPHREKKKKKK